MGIVAGCLTILWIALQVRGWAKAQKSAAERAAIEAAEQRAMLRRIDKELHPANGDGGGPTLRDDVHRNSRHIRDLTNSLADHRVESAREFQLNYEAHADIRREIAGVWQALLGPGANGPRTLHERHQAQRKDDSDE